MPALNIYVTDHLKRRMAKVDTNWSEICRKAIETELLRRENKVLSSFNIEDVKEWITEELDPLNEHSGVVIKPYLHTNGKNQNQVKILSQFYEEMICEVRRSYLNSIQGTVQALVDGKHQVDLLFPGREWISGTLGLKLSLLLNTPKKTETDDEIFDGEFLDNDISIPLLESGLTELIINNSSQPIEIIEYVDIDPEIANYQQQGFNIPELPSEIYSIFRKAWKSLYSKEYNPPPKPPSADVIKNFWEKWYHPKTIIETSNWLDHWCNRYKSDRYVYEWETIISSFIYVINDDDFDPSISEIPEKIDYINGIDIQYIAFVEYISKFIFDAKIIELDQINPYALPSIQLSEKDDLSEEPGIYFVLDDEAIYYIGLSANLQETWYSHNKQKEFDLIKNGRIAFIDSLPIHYLSKVKSSFIRAFSPKLSIQ